MLETRNNIHIELVEMNQPMQAVGEGEVFWHLELRTDHLEKSLDAATNAGFDVTIPIRPLVTREAWMQTIRVAALIYEVLKA